MWKDKKFTILASVLAAILVIGASAGIVLAQNGDDGAGPHDGMLPGPEDSILPRVAQILGIDQQKLVEAFQQARAEYREQHPPRQPNLEQRLEEAVQEGKLTQQQADEVKAWLAKRPANPKDNPEQFKEWLDSRPSDIPMLQPHKFCPWGFPPCPNAQPQP